MRTLFRWGSLVVSLVEVQPVTEPEAYEAILAHVRACPVCADKQLRQCSTYVELHDAWKGIEANQEAMAC